MENNAIRMYIQLSLKNFPTVDEDSVEDTSPYADSTYDGGAVKGSIMYCCLEYSLVFSGVASIVRPSFAYIFLWWKKSAA